MLTFFPIAKLLESKKGQNLINISRNSLKRLSGHLTVDPKSDQISESKLKQVSRYRVDKVSVLL